MATYEFKCPSCGATSEKSFPVTQERVMLPTCRCGSTMKRVFSAPGVIFKGGGFYSSDKAK